jgi:hypothetical protein
MEIKVNRAEFIKAIAITRRALSKIIIQQERGHLLLSVADGKMRITGTNNDLKAHYILDVLSSGASKVAFTCDPKILSNVLSKMDVAEATLEFDEADMSVKVFTNDSGSSFAKLQSFPAKMMLTFEVNPNRSVAAVPRKVLMSALKYAVRYLSPPKDDSRNFDIVSISKGVMYAANGSNMMGFMVSGAFKPLESVCLRKAIIPILSMTLSDIEDETVGVIQNQSDVGIETERMYFSALKPAMEPPTALTQHVKSEGAYTSVERSVLMKHLDRLVASHTGPADAIGVQVTLGGAGDSSYLDLSLVSSKSVERVPCARVDDASAEDITHTVDYKVFKAVLGSLEYSERIRLHINDESSKMFKAYDKGTIDKESFIEVGIGGYVKAVTTAG